MRHLIFIILLTVFIQSFGQTNHKLKGKPTTLEETYVYLDQIFDDTTKYGFMTLPEDVAAGRLHFGFGMWIRNNWGLWRNSKLKQYFLAKGITHPDDMSSIILTSYHRYLNNKIVDLDGQTKRRQDFYKGVVRDGNTIIFPEEFFKDRTSDSTLVKYFPINDTIFVSIYASYRRFLETYASSIRATAIVHEHRGDNLFVEIIEIRNEPRKKTERKVGDSFEVQPINCSLIPPNDWIFKKNKTNE